MSLWKVMKLGLIHSAFWTTIQLSVSNMMLRCPTSVFVKYETFLKYGRGKREALYGINYFVLINGNITFQKRLNSIIVSIIKGDWLHLN